MPLACLRSIFLPAFVASLLILSGAFYLEYGLGQVACPLCQGQRLLLGAFALVCLCALIRRPSQAGARLCLWLCLMLAFAGVLLAARHVWLQGHFPPADSPCLHSMTWLIEQGEAVDWVQSLWVGSAECVSMTWSFLSLSVPEWSLLAFLGLGLGAGLQLSAGYGWNPGVTPRS